jgi:mono/diheme cytochrome c family protein
MPPLKENLGDDQIAVVLTYVRSRLAGNHAAAISPAAVAAARKEARAAPESAEALLRVSAE